MPLQLKQLQNDLTKMSQPERAEKISGFFKTGVGEYGEGDIFLGIDTPSQRKIAKQYLHLNLGDVSQLLSSKYHDYRFVALVILIAQYQKASPPDKKKIYNLYLSHYKYINNWDLVDVSAPHIVGNYLLDKDRKILYQWAQSSSLWKKRIAIIATFTFIRAEDFQDTLKIAKILLRDNHDLIHKAVGWMLREVGKRNQRVLEQFLHQHRLAMPRTMLRYAIEKFDPVTRNYYLKK